MPPDDLNLLLEQKGPWFLVAALALRDLLPFLRDKLFPEFVKSRKEENERRWSLSERQVQAHETIAAAIQQQAVILATMDARYEVIASDVSYIKTAVTELNIRDQARGQSKVTTRRSARRSVNAS